jgi:hypothetical protein
MRDISKLAEKLSSLTLVEAAELRNMLEKQWGMPPKQKPKFTFNEGKVCDAVILRLEEREGSTRENLRSPEDAELDRTRVVCATSNVNANIRRRSRTTAHVSGGLNISGHQGRRGNFSRMRQPQ